MNKVKAVLIWTIAACPLIGIFHYDIPNPEPASVVVFVMILILLGVSWWVQE